MSSVDNNNEETSNSLDLLASTQGFDIGNFDPNNIQTDEVICVVIAMDISPSIQDFEDDLNLAFSEFIGEMQRSHVADKLMVKIITFNEDVEDKTGFQPISAIDASQLKFRGKGRGTALNEAAFNSVATVGRYRNDLENTGIQCKSLVFLITDGEDNQDRTGDQAAKCRELVNQMAKDENTSMTFETIMFGVGSSGAFKQSQQDLNFKHLAVVGNSGKEIRKMIGFVSASISRSSANQAVTF